MVVFVAPHSGWKYVGLSCCDVLRGEWRCDTITNWVSSIWIKLDIYTHSWTPPELHERMFVVDAVRLLVDVITLFSGFLSQEFVIYYMSLGVHIVVGVWGKLHACLAELSGNFRSVAKVVRNRKRHNCGSNGREGNESIFFSLKSADIYRKSKLKNNICHAILPRIV